MDKNIILDKYAPLFHSKWEKLANDNITILGYWAEDLNEYNVVVPPQLRDLILDMQNSLCDTYKEIKTKEMEINLLKDKLEVVLK